MSLAIPVETSSSGTNVHSPVSVSIVIGCDSTGRRTWIPLHSAGERAPPVQLCPSRDAKRWM